MSHPDAPPPFASEPPPVAQPIDDRLPLRSAILTGVLLLPVLAAVWTVPGFVTQDGPAHVYNAWILASSFSADSPYAGFFTVQWRLLPNWAGHLAIAGLMQVVSPWTADRLLMSVTLLGFSGSLVWLRARVSGARNGVGSSLLAVILALNFLWLLGFTSFLLGACLFPITLGVWWSGRDRLRPGRLAALSGLLVVGYFCHLVTLGITVFALTYLAIASPRAEAERARGWGRFQRLASTSLCFVPLLFLGVNYLILSRQGGPMKPLWETLADPYSATAWVARLGWVDPLSMARKNGLPFTERVHPGFVVFAPVMWTAIGFVFWWMGRRTDPARRRTQRLWLGLAAILLVAAVLGPDSLGPGHGEYLLQRLALLGLMAVVPAFDVVLTTLRGRLTAFALAVAVALQSAVIWDYALYSDRTAGQIMRSADLVGSRQRIATMPARIRGRFRSNPLLHADCWLGVGSGNILWSNYETRYYYFPVHFREGLDRPDSSDLERLAMTDDPKDAAARARDWERILEEHGGSIDRVLVWKTDPALDAATERRFRLIGQRGNVRIFARDEPKPRPIP